jgi:hypothetical protein
LLEKINAEIGWLLRGLQNLPANQPGSAGQFFYRREKVSREQLFIAPERMPDNAPPDI